jgi:hypothetical protein
MVGALNHLDPHFFNAFFDLVHVRAFRIIILQQHTGRQMHHIQIIFQKFFHQTGNPAPGTSPAGEKSDNLRVVPVPGEMLLPFIKSLKAGHTWANFRHRLTADYGNPQFVFIRLGFFRKFNLFFVGFPDVFDGYLLPIGFFNFRLYRPFSHAPHKAGYLFYFF